MVAAAALKRALEAGGDGTHSALVYLAAVKHGDVKKLYLDFLKSPADNQENVLAVLEHLPRSCNTLEVCLLQAPWRSFSTVADAGVDHRCAPTPCRTFRTCSAASSPS